MSKKNEKAVAAAAAAAATAAAVAENAYDSMSDPDIEIEDKSDNEVSRTATKTAVNVSRRVDTTVLTPL